MPRTATGSRIFFFSQRFDAITFVTSSHRRPTRAFPIRCEEQKCAEKENIRLPVAVRGSRTSVLKLPIGGRRALSPLLYLCSPVRNKYIISHTTGSGWDCALTFSNYPYTVHVVHIMSSYPFFRVMVSCCAMTIPSMKENLLETACCLARYEAQGLDKRMQHCPTLLNPTFYTRLTTMFHDVERRLISIKGRLYFFSVAFEFYQQESNLRPSDY